VKKWDKRLAEEWERESLPRLAFLSVRFSKTRQSLKSNSVNR
jgi:hypothetical protein